MSEVDPVGPEEIASLLPDALHRPAVEGARVVALHWLHELLRQRDHWSALHVAAAATAAAVAAAEHSDEDEAPHNRPTTDGEPTARSLHKARVALRRLRAVQREHRDALQDAWSGSTDRALRALGKATNAIRDRDVQMAWLDAEAEGLPNNARAEAVLLRQQLANNAEAVFEQVEAAFSRHLDPISARLTQRLSWFLQRQRIGNGALVDLRYADLVAARLEKGARRIRRDVARLLDERGELDAMSDNVQERLHDIRLRLKRHRALLAPFTDAQPALAALFDIETRGQDLLGAMRDADILASRARKEEFHALERALGDTRLSKLTVFIDEWVDAADDVQQQFDAAIAALRDIGKSRTSDNNSSQEAHGLPMEIERKFLLNDVPAEAIAMPPIVIEQGWIPGTMLRERLRRSTYPDGRVRCTRTIKLGKPEARIEIEEDTGNSIFQAMWALTSSARIRKRRHVVRDAVHVWEIDVFSDRELVLAEVELDALDTPVNIPDWLAPYIVREVTGETAYLNSQMARPDLSDTAAAAIDRTSAQ